MLPQTKGAQKIFKHKMLNMEHIPQLNSKNLYNVKSKILYSLAGPHAACGLPSELYRSSGTSGFRKTWQEMVGSEILGWKMVGSEILGWKMVGSERLG